jgi:hypothetical protein
MASYNKIIVAEGDVFYENVKTGKMYAVEDGDLTELRSTPAAFYKFRTDVVSIEPADTIDLD